MRTHHPILTKIRNRPALYIGCQSLIRLQAFMQGYLTCEFDHGLTVAISETPEFCEWLSRRLKISGSLGYVEMLLALHEGDDAAAFDDFWLYLDEYQAEKISDEK